MPNRTRPTIIVGAASNIGIRPYESGAARQIDGAPAALRQLGLVERLGAADLGDVIPPAYTDFEQRPGTVRNERQLQAYTLVVADRIEAALDTERFTIVLGGDCSILLGSLLGAAHGGRRVGLVYIDAHADFATPEESATGSAAGMCLAMAVGRGPLSLARWPEAFPLVLPGDVVTIGRRDPDRGNQGYAAFARSGILDIPGDALASAGPDAVAARTSAFLNREDLDGFWIHLDADVIDPLVMPAVDSPEPGGPGFDDVARLLEPLVRDPRAVGLQLTIYDPFLDGPGRAAGRGLVRLLCDALNADDS